MDLLPDYIKMKGEVIATMKLEYNDLHAPYIAWGGRCEIQRGNNELVPHPNPLMHLNLNSRFFSRGSGGFTRGKRPGNQRGFTLIEVLLSLAVVAVSAMAIIGSIDMALATFDESIQETVQSQIVQQLTTQASQTDFSNLNAFVTASPYYYDASGVQVTTASQAEYTAQVYQVAAPSGIAFSANNLDLFQAQIYTTRGAAQPNTNDPSEATYTFRIANTGNRL